MPFGDQQGSFGARKTSQVPGQRKKTIKVKTPQDFDEAVERLRETFDGSVGARDVGYVTLSIEYGDDV